MARQTTVQLIDDLDGGPAEVTVRFGWDGVEYEIDLSAARAEQFGAAVRPYLDAARRVGPARGGRRSATTGSRARAGGSVGEQAVIRNWARAHGMAIADRGRIPAEVVDAYRASRALRSDSTSGPSVTGGTSGDAAAGVRPGHMGGATTSAAKKASAKTRTANGSAAGKASARTRAATKSSAAKKVAAKKVAAKKSVAKKTVAAKKVAAKKSAAKKAVPAKRARVSASGAGARGRVRKSSVRKRSTSTAAKRAG